MWHVTWWEANLFSSKFHLRSSYSLQVEVFWKYLIKGWPTEFMYEIITKVRESQWIVRDYKIMVICGKALGVSWWILSLARFQGQKPLGPAAHEVFGLGTPKEQYSPRYPLGFSTYCICGRWEVRNHQWINFFLYSFWTSSFLVKISLNP